MQLSPLIYAVINMSVAESPIQDPIGAAFSHFIIFIFQAESTSPDKASIRSTVCDEKLTYGEITEESKKTRSPSTEQLNLSQLQNVGLSLHFVPENAYP